MEQLTKEQRQELIFRYSKIKGVIGEQIVEGLFEFCDYSVTPSGYEKTKRSTYEAAKIKGLEVPLDVRQEPDFLILGGGDLGNDCLRVEVKYRHNGILDHRAVRDFVSVDYPYPKAVVLVLSRSKFYCVSVQELVNLGKPKQINLTKDEQYRLVNRDEFSLNPEVVKLFERYAQGFYKSLLSKQEDVLSFLLEADED